MASNSKKTLELTILSAEGLRVRGKSANKNVFVVVRAESIASHTTAMTNGNDGFHSWNHKFSVDIAPHAMSLTLEVKRKTGTGAVRDVGVARIALTDFLGGLVPDHCLQFLCYRLRDWDGRQNGIINFSVRVAAAAAPPLDGSDSCGLRVRSENDHRTSPCSGVVTGFPVWWNNNN